MEDIAPDSFLPVGSDMLQSSLEALEKRFFRITITNAQGVNFESEPDYSASAGGLILIVFVVF